MYRVFVVATGEWLPPFRSAEEALRAAKAYQRSHGGSLQPRQPTPWAQCTIIMGWPRVTWRKAQRMLETGKCICFRGDKTQIYVGKH